MERLARHGILRSQKVCGDLFSDGADEYENLFFVRRAVILQQTLAEPGIAELSAPMINDDLAEGLSDQFIHRYILKS